MRTLFRSIVVLIGAVLGSGACGHEWRMSAPTKYTFVLLDSTVLTLEAMSKEVRARIDSVGLHRAELTFRNKEMLILEYENGGIARMRIRGTRVECLAPDSMVQRIEGLQFSRTVLTWPGRWKRAADADLFCLHLNDAMDYTDPPRYPFMVICFRDGCARAGPPEKILIDEH